MAELDFNTLLLSKPPVLTRVLDYPFDDMLYECFARHSRSFNSPFAADPAPSLSPLKNRPCRDAMALEPARTTSGSVTGTATERRGPSSAIDDDTSELKHQAFPFLALPRELRDAIYDELIEVEQWPAVRRSATRFSFNRAVGDSSAMLSASRQINEEIRTAIGSRACILYTSRGALIPHSIKNPPWATYVASLELALSHAGFIDVFGFASERASGPEPLRRDCVASRLQALSRLRTLVLRMPSPPEFNGLIHARMEADSVLGACHGAVVDTIVQCAVAWKGSASLTIKGFVRGDVARQYEKLEGRRWHDMPPTMAPVGIGCSCGRSCADTWDEV